MTQKISKATYKVFFLTLLKALVFLSLIGLLILYNTHRPRIMIIHSYDPGIDIVKDFDNGIASVLQGKVGPLITYYYINALSQNSEQKLKFLGIKARKAIKRFNPSILIIVGDEAQKTVGKYYVHSKSVKIIFAGVKDDIKKLGYKVGKNVGGILQPPQIDEINYLLRAIFPNKTKIRLAHIGDNSIIAQLIAKQLSDYSWSNVKLIQSVFINTEMALKEALLTLKDKADVIFISTYKALHINSIALETLKEWMADHIKQPIISTFGYLVTEGIADIAVTPSAFEEGVLAMEAALKMLKNPHYLPNINSSLFSVSINNNQLLKKHITIPEVYQSLATNSQKSYED